MIKSTRRVTSILALSAAMMAAGSVEATGGAEAANLRGEAQAKQEAAKITHIINEPKSTYQVAPVPGILKGVVELHDSESGGTNIYRNPVLLWESHSTAQIDKNHKLLNGSWIGVPGVNTSNRLVLEPIQIDLGKQPIAGTKYFYTMPLHLSPSGDVVLEGYGVKIAPPSTTVPQGLDGVNLQNANSPYIPIISR